MQILATNLSSLLLSNMVLNYNAVSGSAVSDTVTLPPAPPGGCVGPMASGSQPASAFTGVTITIAGTAYTVPYGMSLPSGLPVQVEWSQDANASLVIVLTGGIGGGI